MKITISMLFEAKDGKKHTSQVVRVTTGVGGDESFDMHVFFDRETADAFSKAHILPEEPDDGKV